jgi:glycogen operon protein
LLCLIFNAGADAVDFVLPAVLPGTLWHLAVDTSHESPKDIYAAGREPVLETQKTYLLGPQSSAILVAGAKALKADR